MKDNIVLIGMPGVGKSTVGVILAKIAGYNFIDADIVIQKTSRKLLKDIIAELGTEGFIEYENKVGTTINPNRSVIATGGSAVYGKEAMEHYREIATVIFLKLELGELSKRLGNLQNRGVVLRDGQTLEDIYNERTPLYEQYADIVIDTTGGDIEGTIAKILDSIS